MVFHIRGNRVKGNEETGDIECSQTSLWPTMCVCVSACALESLHSGLGITLKRAIIIKIYVSFRFLDVIEKHTTNG